MNSFIDRCEKFCREQTEAEKMAAASSLSSDDRANLQEQISASSHSFAHDIVEIIGTEPSRWLETGKLLREHRAHSHFLMQSEFISQALKKPYGYAGDKDLMLTIYENRDRGPSEYAMLCNNVYQWLPAAEAVRVRVRGIEGILKSLPSGSHVMSLACGPAYEVKNYLNDNGRQISFDLLDHDPMSIAYTFRTLGNEGIRHIQCNAYDLIKGIRSLKQLRGGTGLDSFEAPFVLSGEKYDMIYSTGLYDYIKYFPLNKSRGVSGLTATLFDFLKPGGRLFIGNFLRPGNENLHIIPHRFMMEAYSEWFLLYRTPDEIAGFAEMIKLNAEKLELLDADLVHPISERSTIGFLVLTKAA